MHNTKMHNTTTTHNANGQVMLDTQGHPLLIRKRQHYTQIWENEVPLPGNAHL